jgi:hypothetical protein
MWRPDWSNIECASPAPSEGNACSIQQRVQQQRPEFDLASMLDACIAKSSRIIYFDFTLISTLIIDFTRVIF